MAVQIRPAQAEDFPAFVQLIRQLAAFEKLEPPTPEAEARLFQDGFDPAGKHRFFPVVAVLEGAIVGYAMYFFTYSSFLAAPTLYLEDVYVDPAYRGQQIGQALMKYLARQVQAEGCQRLDLTVLDWNTSAQAFYQSLGGTPHLEWQLYRFEAPALAKLAAE